MCTPQQKDYRLCDIRSVAMQSNENHDSSPFGFMSIASLWSSGRSHNDDDDNQASSNAKRMDRCRRQNSKIVKKVVNNDAHFEKLKMSLKNSGAKTTAGVCASLQVCFEQRKSSFKKNSARRRNKKKIKRASVLAE
mmetsp:Transcript_28482/g.43790  ORF Transcript_28482/g.43790 Transcript_28482/m.43790 type:complete len:136 (+) Transcript_28482:49-456(+)